MLNTILYPKIVKGNVGNFFFKGFLPRSVRGRNDNLGTVRDDNKGKMRFYRPADAGLQNDNIKKHAGGYRRVFYRT
jgi:hypothetical protein